tara:strand:- start:4867 stop:5004 length:138 start_codon:yes stop_codon:yes gene_type:complete
MLFLFARRLFFQLRDYGTSLKKLLKIRRFSLKVNLQIIEKTLFME